MAKRVRKCVCGKESWKTCVAKRVRTCVPVTSPVYSCLSRELRSSCVLLSSFMTSSGLVDGTEVFCFFAEAILTCNWQNGRPVCWKESGFDLRTQVAYEVTIDIPSMKSAKYHCDTFPSGGDVNVQICDFIVKSET